MKILVGMGKLSWELSRFGERLKKEYITSQFKSIGEHCYLGRDLKLTPQNITLGNHVSIGAGSVIQSSHGEIIIGDHVMLGPNVHIHGGNHIFTEIGCYIDEAPPKKMGQDGKIVIEDDVWIGSCSIILKGVHIGRGSVIGGGAIVTKDVPPYSIYMNKIEPIIRKRFSDEEIKEHEQQIKKKYGEK